MPALNFQPRFAPMIESGAKVLTMRVPRADNRFPCPMSSREPLKLYTGMRTKDCRVILQVPSPVVVATVRFSATGYEGHTMVEHGDSSDPLACRVVRNWMDSSVLPQHRRDMANEQLAMVDGFTSWADLWAWHRDNGLDHDGQATRNLVGWA